MSLDPNAKVELKNPLHRSEGDKTYKQFHLEGLTDEVLRDMARNEAAERAWRKAAVEFLIDRGSKYAQHPEFSFLVDEIKKEREARQEVEAVVESATEAAVIDRVTEVWPTVDQFLNNPEFIAKLKEAGYEINKAAVDDFRKKFRDFPTT